MDFSSRRTTTPSARLNNLRWILNHQKDVVLAKNTTSKTILIGDSIIYGMRRYENVWDKFFQPINTLNFATDVAFWWWRHT